MEIPRPELIITVHGEHTPEPELQSAIAEMLSPLGELGYDIHLCFSSEDLNQGRDMKPDEIPF
jgi:hypothetical protein